MNIINTLKNADSIQRTLDAVAKRSAEHYIDMAMGGSFNPCGDNLSQIAEALVDAWIEVNDTPLGISHNNREHWVEVIGNELWEREQDAIAKCETQ